MALLCGGGLGAYADFGRVHRLDALRRAHAQRARGVNAEGFTLAAIAQADALAQQRIARRKRLLQRAC